MERQVLNFNIEWLEALWSVLALISAALSVYLWKRAAAVPSLPDQPTLTSANSLPPYRGVLFFLSEAWEGSGVKRREFITLLGGAAAGTRRRIGNTALAFPRPGATDHHFSYSR